MPNSLLCCFFKDKSKTKKLKPQDIILQASRPLNVEVLKDEMKKEQGMKR